MTVIRPVRGGFTVTLAGVILSVVLPSGPLEAQDHYAGVRYRAWFAEAEGKLRADGGGFVGSFADVEDDLDLERSRGIYSAVAWLEVPEFGRVKLDYTQGEWDGDQVLGAPITFGGTPFFSSDDIHTDLKWESIRTTFEYALDLPFGNDEGRFRLGLATGTLYLRLEQEVFTQTATGRATPDGIIPFFAGSAEFYLGNVFSLELEAMGTSVTNFASFSAKIFDASVALRLGSGGLFAGVGYRWITIELEEDRKEPDEFEGDLEITGIFIEAGLRF